MDSALGTLLTAGAALAAVTVAVVRAGRRQRRFRGWPQWAAALTAGSAGVLLAAGGAPDAGPWASLLARLLLLAWPVLLLAGVRRFHGRLGLPGRSRTDAFVLGGAAVSTLLAAALPAAEPVSGLLPAVAALLLHLYVAAVLAGGRAEDNDLSALRMLAAATALAMLVPAAAWMVTGAPLADLPDTGLRIAATALALTLAALTMLALMSERTERELRESRRRLQVLAYTDALTGIPNRRHFEDLAARVVHAGRTPVLLLFDIDHFKHINDRLGHAAGDRALQLVGEGLRAALRAGDIAGRLGGDEFALLLDGASPPQAVGIADRIVRQLQAAAPSRRLPRDLGLSFGLVQIRPFEPLGDALHRADQALYEAKRQGRSCVVAARGGEDQPVFSESQRLGLTPM